MARFLLITQGVNEEDETQTCPLSYPLLIACLSSEGVLREETS